MARVRKIRKMKKPSRPLDGLKGKMKTLSYTTGVKINLGQGSYSSVEIRLSGEVELGESDSPSEIMDNLTNHLNQEMETLSEERKEYWMEELGLNIE